MDGSMTFLLEALVDMDNCLLLVLTVACGSRPILCSFRLGGVIGDREDLQTTTVVKTVVVIPVLACVDVADGCCQTGECRRTRRGIDGWVR
jgi:hypothetical protein